MFFDFRHGLLDDLGSGDLATQHAAREQVVKGGASCLGFIGQALEDPQSGFRDGRARERGLLIDSLVSVVDALQDAHVQVSNDIYAKLAILQDNRGEYSSAERYFGRLSQELLLHDPDLLFFFGYTELKLKKYDEASKLFGNYQMAVPELAQASASFHANMGPLLFQLGKREEDLGRLDTALQCYQKSEQEWKAAKALKPTLSNVDISIQISEAAAGVVLQKQTRLPK
jgi:tetratricopeptide (TPR) repeat protein